MEFRSVFVLSGTPLLQRFWGQRLSGYRRRCGGREPIPQGVLLLNQVHCLNCHGTFGVAPLKQHGALWRHQATVVGEHVVRHLILWAELYLVWAHAA